MDLHGVHTFSPEEYAERTEIQMRPAKSLVKLVQSKTENEFIIDYSSYSTAINDFCFHTAAMSAILSWLNFPVRLRPFLDCVIGMTADAGNETFTATDLDLGLQMRAGRQAKSESTKKAFSRDKRDFREWQDFKRIELVRISGRRFDARKQRCEPTEYQVNITEWAARAVTLAQNMPEWSRSRAAKAKCIRKAAADVLRTIDNCPPLEPVKTKTYSNEQLVNRAVRTALNSISKVEDIMTREGVSPEVVGLFFVGKIDQITTNPRGEVGAVLTPEKDAPKKDLNFYKMFKSGEINNEIEEAFQNVEEKINLMGALGFDQIEYAAQMVKAEEREVETPRQWKDGKFVELSNTIELKNDDSPLGQITSSPLGQNTESASDNFQEIENSVCNSLKTKDVIGTKSALTIGTNSDDFTDWATESIGEKRESNPFEIVNEWSRQVAEKIPPATSSQKFSDKGCWDICWQMVTSKARISDAELHERCQSIIDGIFNLDTLKPAFVEWVMVRLERYRNGVPAPITDEKRAEFRKRLESFLTIPDG